MSRNRKNQSAAIRFGPAIKAFLLCLFIGGSGVGYVWQKSQINELSNQIRHREQELRGLQDQNEKLRRQYAMMCSPKYLEAKIKELNLGLVSPQPSQVWRLPSSPAFPAPTGERQYASQPASGPTWR